MSNDDKDIGKLLAYAESHGKQLSEIFRKIEKIEREGCAVGCKPTTSAPMAIGAGVGGAGILTAIVEIFKALTQ